MEKQNRIWLLVAIVIVGAAVLVAMLISRSNNQAVVNEEYAPIVGEENGQVVPEVVYTDDDRAQFETYLRANLSALSPEKEVLGGTFYLTSLNWMTDKDAYIEYEDGHIAVKANVGFSFSDEAKTQIQNDYFMIIPEEAAPVSQEIIEGEVWQEEPIIEPVVEPVIYEDSIEEPVEMPAY